MIITMHSVAASQTSATARPGQDAEYSSIGALKGALQGATGQDGAIAADRVNLYDAIEFLSLAKVLELAVLQGQAVNRK